MSRPSAKFLISPNPRDCVNKLPITVVSTGPAKTGQLQVQQIGNGACRPNMAAHWGNRQPHASGPANEGHPSGAVQHNRIERFDHLDRFTTNPNYSPQSHREHREMQIRSNTLC